MVSIGIDVKTIFMLIIAIVVTVLVSKLKYFKNVDKSSGKKFIISGIWIYSISSMPILRGTIGGLIFIGSISIWEFISYIGLILALIGIVLCNIPKTTKDNTTTSKIENTKTDDINLF